MKERWKLSVCLISFFFLPASSYSTPVTTCNCQIQQSQGIPLDTDGRRTKSVGNWFQDQSLSTPHFQLSNKRKKGEVLQLGLLRDPFMGPRKRKRRTIIQSNTQLPLTLIYAIPFNNSTQIKQIANEQVRYDIESPTNQDIPQDTGKYLEETKYYGHLQRNQQQPNSNHPQIHDVATDFQKSAKNHRIVRIAQHSPYYPPNYLYHFITKSNQPIRNQKVSITSSNDPAKVALNEAWRTYGPDPTRALLPRYPQFPSRDGSRIEFQPMDSEWKLTQDSATISSHEPTYLSHLLSRYVGFEVNNYDITELLRKTAFILVVVALSGGWILLGMLLGVIPSTLVLPTRRNLDTTGGTSWWGNGYLNEIRERVQMALDGDWLRKLEKKVKDGDDWLSTSVHCCILPSNEIQGQVDCELIRRGRNLNSPFTCLTDLIYNFNFGDPPPSVFKKPTKMSKKPKMETT